MITLEELRKHCSWVVAFLFSERYPEGASLPELERDAAEHDWIAEILPVLKEWAGQAEQAVV